MALTMSAPAEFDLPLASLGTIEMSYKSYKQVFDNDWICQDCISLTFNSKLKTSKLLVQLDKIKIGRFNEAAFNLTVELVSRDKQLTNYYIIVDVSPIKIIKDASF